MSARHSIRAIALMLSDRTAQVLGLNPPAERAQKLKTAKPGLLLPENCRDVRDMNGSSLAASRICRKGLCVTRVSTTGASAIPAQGIPPNFPCVAPSGRRW